jgi:hypothetical protein
MLSTMPGLDKPGGTEYRRATRNAVDGAARGTRSGQDCGLLQMMRDACAPRFLHDGGQEPERTSSAPGMDLMPQALRVFVIALCEGGLP